MSTWTSDKLSNIGAAEELQIASVRRDGTLRNPVTIWVVRLGDDLYVRSVNGRTSSWFRGAQVRHEGRISKYRRHAASIISRIMSLEVRSATIKRRMATGGMGRASSGRRMGTLEVWAKPSF